MGKKINIRKFSEIVGFSMSTVSKALRDSSEISAETTSYIKKMALVHGYVPSNAGKSLKLSLSGAVGVVLPNLKNDFFVDLIQAFEEEAFKRKLKITVCFSHNSIQREKELFRFFLDNSVDGILVSLAKETQKVGDLTHIEQAIASDLPLVMFDRINDSIECDKVIIDDFEGAKSATEFLFDSGCRSLLFISSNANTSIGEQRKKGFLVAVERLQKLKGKKGVYIESKNHKVLTKRLKNYFAVNKNKIDGILAVDEISAAIALGLVVNELNLSVPENISIVSFSDGKLTKYLNPSLSAIDQNASEMAKKSMDRLCYRIGGKNSNKRPYRKYMVKHRMILRESTRQITV